MRKLCLYLHYQSLRGRAGVARWAHNPKVTSSNLVPATNESPDVNPSGFFIYERMHQAGLNAEVKK